MTKEDKYGTLLPVVKSVLSGETDVIAKIADYIYGLAAGDKDK